jgi:hypothetical protein
MYLDQQLLIETDRLFLVPMTYSFVSRILDKDITAYDEFDISPNPEWPNLDTKEIMPILKAAANYYNPKA